MESCLNAYQEVVVPRSRHCKRVPKSEEQVNILRTRWSYVALCFYGSAVDAGENAE